MNKYYIYVWQTQYPDYPAMTGYDVEAVDRDAAQIIAKMRFHNAFGFDPKFIATRVGWTVDRQKEDLQYYRDHGLPDEIPS